MYEVKILKLIKSKRFLTNLLGRIVIKENNSLPECLFILISNTNENYPKKNSLSTSVLAETKCSFLHWLAKSFCVEIRTNRGSLVK